MKTSERKRESSKQYYLKNKEKIKLRNEKNKEKISEKNKQYYIKNKEKFKKNNEKYYIENKDNIKTNARIYYELNKERLLENFKNYQKNNKEAIKKQQKNWYDNNLDKVKDNKLKYIYNISLNEYNELYSKQNGKCAICGKHQDELKYMLSVDHNHQTNIIRGLLCNKCNRGLGYFNDNLDIISSALNYLKSTLEKT